MFEWTDAKIYWGDGCLRGGLFMGGQSNPLTPQNCPVIYLDAEHYNAGFRIVAIPEPATLSLLAVGGLAALRKRRK